MVFLLTGSATDDICKNNDEDFNNENQKDNSNVDSLVSRLMVTVEEQKRAKDFVELIEGKLWLIVFPILYQNSVKMNLNILIKSTV